MRNYTVFTHDAFDQVYSRLDTSERNWIGKVKKQLEDNPTGKVIRFSWFREKKYLNKRLYYLVEEEDKKILLVAFGSKKEQNKTISLIICNMKELLDYLREC